MPAILLDTVSYSYGDRQALKKVSFAVERAQISALLGPNGGGKTTIFRILSTLLPPTEGRVEVDGKNILTSQSEVRRSIGVVFQSSSADLELTTLENLTCQGHLYGLRGGELKRRIAELLERYDLQDRASEPLKKFSGGLQRRVELAKALLHKPEILLLDEPTNGLDPKVSRSFWNHLLELRDEEKKTILITTHSMEEADRCDYLIILNEGRIVSRGSPQSLKYRLGDEVLSIRASDPENLGKKISDLHDVTPQIMGNLIRIEHSNVQKLVAEILDGFSDEIESITVSHPTLEDVFVHETGRPFESQEPS